MPQAPQLPMPQAAQAAQAATRAGPSPLGRAAHLAHAHAASSSLAPAASSPLAPSPAASPLFSALGAAPSPPTAPTNLSPHAALSSHATFCPHAALSPHANLSAASTPTSLSDAQHTIQELEARIRQLELEKICSPQPAAFSPAAAAATSPAAAFSPAAAVAAAAARATMPTVPATAAFSPAATTAAAATAAAVTAATAAATATAAAAAAPPPTPDSTLVLLDFSPEWDEACGGAKMLLTAGTRPGCSYAARFGDVVVGAVLVQPNVLRVHVPPAPGERGGDVALRLLCLSPQGQLLHESGPARFRYRGGLFGRRSESGSSRGHTPPPLMSRAASYDSFGPRLGASFDSRAALSSQSLDRSPSSSPFGVQPVPLRLAAAASLSGASPLSAFGLPRVPRSPACSAASSSVGHLELGQLDLLMAGDGGGGGGGGSSSDGDDGDDSGDDSGGGGGSGSGSDAVLGGAAEGDSLFAMALSLTSGPESALEQQFVQLIGALGDDDVTQLRRLQRAVRHRLRHRAPTAHRAGPADSLAQVVGAGGDPRLLRQLGGALSECGEAWGEGGVDGGDDHMGSDEAVSRVQRTFRSRRRQRIDIDSRRRAALAIERHYLKRHRGGALAGMSRSISLEARRARDSGGAAGDDGRGDVSDVGMGLIMRAQAAFRARQARKQAVRRIEQTYLEWRYHAEQANLAAQGVRDSGGAPGDADTSLQLHHYHAQCRERAARTIQGFLLKQQQQSDAAEAGAASGDLLLGGDVRDPSPFSEVQLQLLRRAQRAFRAHVARQAEDAQELAEQTRRDATAVAGHAGLCEVLRRAAAGDALAADESSLLAQLQLAFRSNLERRRRAANTIWKAAERRRSTMPRVDEAHEGLSGPHPAPMHE